ncbi:MAG: hypothetical protein C0508_27620 [Cyanobacteria bacterium PR.023]|nr:hypothetical protein [Cyanobacteria bacterium PR.023]
MRGSVKAIAQSKGEKPLYMTKAVKSVQGWQASREALARAVLFKKSSSKKRKVSEPGRSPTLEEN